MARPNTGSVYLDRGKWRIKLTLGERVFYTFVPPRKDGREITRAYAEIVKDKLLERWRLGLWSPFEEAEKPTNTHNVLDFVRLFVSRQEYENKQDDLRKIERYIKPHPISTMQLVEVKPSHVASFLEYLEKLPSKRGGVLAPRTVRNIYSVLQRAFARAVVDEVWEVSPCESVAKAGMLPSVEDKKPTERVGWKYTRTQVQQLLFDARIPSDRRVFYALLFLTGARVGEVSALTWGDYESDSLPLGKLTISKAYKSKTRKVSHTKTKAIKEVPVHPTLASILEEWKNTGYEEFTGNVPAPESLLIPNRRNRPRSTGVSHARFIYDLEKLEINKKSMLVHSARHTFISLSRSDGAKRDLLRWVTHAPPRTDSHDSYTSPEWEALCAEVGRLNITQGLAHGLAHYAKSKR